MWSGGGKVTVIDSTIRGNRAVPTRFGRFAEGGGMFIDSGSLVIRDSTITGNETRLVT